ncbi:metallophosphatase family protein [Ktedonobacter sp. SOSP1-52]|uniref:metallophosphoesterase family protein n=1 Tax=Ktedonobacter sp. SOSP1-52 TaxID=2778366 RepID=UPI001916072B|nr:metallophosphoesterase family protein [Ktedonobacter sp. SOSP1-52]GHO66131.1 metallophosphatase family protein [Ktedonobacter sp. SOSP1-52]
MRIAIISDIHGNQVALEAVLQDLDSQPPVGQIIIAGDLCLNGPRPKEVLDIVQGLHCPVIQGNVDKEVVDDNGVSGPKKRNIIAWTREQIGREGIDYLAQLPFSYRVHNPDGSDILVVHANPQNVEQAIFPNAQDEELTELLASVEQNVGALVFGHLHIPYIRRWHSLLLFDVGSCGLPRDEDVRASYGILNWRNGTWEPEIRRVEYSLDKVIKQLKKCGIPHSDKRAKILSNARY